MAEQLKATSQNFQSQTEGSFPLGQHSPLGTGTRGLQEDDKKLYRQPVDDIVKYIESSEGIKSLSAQKQRVKAKQKRKEDNPELVQTSQQEEEDAISLTEQEVTETKKKKRRRKNRKKNKTGNVEESEDELENTQNSANHSGRDASKES